MAGRGDQRGLQKSLGRSYFRIQKCLLTRKPWLDILLLHSLLVSFCFIPVLLNPLKIVRTHLVKGVRTHPDAPGDETDKKRISLQLDGVLVRLAHHKLMEAIPAQLVWQGSLLWSFVIVQSRYSSDRPSDLLN